MQDVLTGTCYIGVLLYGSQLKYHIPEKESNLLQNSRRFLRYPYFLVEILWFKTKSPEKKPFFIRLNILFVSSKIGLGLLYRYCYYYY